MADPESFEWGGQKHEIQATTFRSRLFTTIFYQTGEGRYGSLASPPPPGSVTGTADRKRSGLW